MAELFGYSVSTINYHLKQVDESGEIHLSDAIRKIRIPSGKWKEQGVLMYNLDVVIAVGYRVNSYEATRFRIWAIQMLIYKTVQNMLHYAVTKQTAAEIVFNRADAEKTNMGLTTWKNIPKGE